MATARAGRPTRSAHERERSGDAEEKLAEVLAAHGLTRGRHAALAEDAFSGADGPCGFPGVVHDGGRDPAVDGVRRAARRSGRVRGDLGDELSEAVAHTGVEGAARPGERDGGGEDVEGGAAVNGRHGDDGGLEGREAPRDDRLERRDDLRGGDDRVARLVR